MSFVPQSEERPQLSFDDFTALRIQTSYERLGKLLKLQVPPAILGKELAMLVERVALRYGREIGAAMAQHQIDVVTGLLGFCPFHRGIENRPLINGSHGMCTDCLREEKAEEQNDDEVGE